MLLVVLVVGAGTAGYTMLGLSPLDALYQTVTTVTTVGFREIGQFDGPEKIFTMVLIVAGVGLVLSTLTLVVQMTMEGQLAEAVGRRRMDRKIADMSGHVVVCGWGRVGRAVADDLVQSGQEVVVLDADPDRVRGVREPTDLDLLEVSLVTFPMQPLARVVALAAASHPTN